jgi:demethylmenaquinone methyltransferase/2-methoxy-6-polyprenyl-1,4-benzoquinol methylase
LTLRSSIATPEGKRRYVRRLFATIADRYDFITRFLSYGQDRRWKRRAIALAQVTPSDAVLDLACGTGDLLFDAAAAARSGVGLDLTFRMLQLAAQRRSRLPAAVSARCRFVAGDMTTLPFPDAAFTVVTTGYGLRNVPDLGLAMSEVHRVLAGGGRLVSLDFNRPRHAAVRGAYWLYLTCVGSLLGLALHGDANTYRYIPESIRNYPGAEGVATLLREIGFEVTVVPVLGGLMAIHLARKR